MLAEATGLLNLFYELLIALCSQLQKHERAVADRGSATYFLHSLHFTVDKNDSFVGCTLC